MTGAVQRQDPVRRAVPSSCAGRRSPSRAGVLPLCGKTIQSVRRNLLVRGAPVLRALGFSWTGAGSPGADHPLRLGSGKIPSSCLEEGRTSGPPVWIQGVTLAGALLDEAVLMPRSFVEQVCARCSGGGELTVVHLQPGGARDTGFIRSGSGRRRRKGALHLTFTMAGQPGLSPKVLARYESMFRGPSTGGSCWANGRRRRGWSMTFQP